MAIQKSIRFVLTSTAVAALSLAGSAGISNSNPSISNPSMSQGGRSTVISAQAAPMNHGGMNHDGMNHGSSSPMTPSGMGHSMALGPADANYDLRFIDAMIPHHEGAIVMAKDVLKKSRRPELQKLATGIIKAQEKEIAQMKQWRKTWYPKAAATPMAWHSEMKHMMPMSPDQIKSMRMDMDLGKADATYDLRFIQAMVPHHEAAVVMARDLAQKTKRPELQQLATAVIASQQAEIDQMKQWQKTWYSK
jgi:uncharacterized protein (DUF305 family)